MPSSPPILSTPPLTAPPTPPPSGLPIVWMLLSVVVGVAVGAGMTMLLGSGGGEAAIPVAASASAEPPAPVEPAPEMPTALELAAKADPEALKAIQSKPAGERSVAEWIALEQSVAAKQRNRIAELKRKIELLPAFGRSKDRKKEILSLARDKLYGIHTLEMLTSLEDEVGPDLIYSAWAGTRKKSSAIKLAKALSYTAEIRKKTSKALNLALELRTVKDCDKLEALLAKVQEQGDRRSLNPMRRFNRRTGCGETKRDDCWKCLRKGDSLRDASAAASKRRSAL